MPWSIPWLESRKTRCVRAQKEAKPPPSECTRPTPDRTRTIAISRSVCFHRNRTRFTRSIRRLSESSWAPMASAKCRANQIPRARLEAIPFARFTVECQSQLEKQNKASRVRQSVTSLFGLTEEEKRPRPRKKSNRRQRRKRNSISLRNYGAGNHHTGMHRGQSVG